MRPTHVLVDSSARTLTSSRKSNCCPLRCSSGRRPLNDSIQAFCHGDPRSNEDGLGVIEPAPVWATAQAMNSGPGRSPRNGVHRVRGRPPPRRRLFSVRWRWPLTRGRAVNDVQEFEHPAVRRQWSNWKSRAHHPRLPTSRVNLGGWVYVNRHAALSRCSPPGPTCSLLIG
jgi:hypothetical protein